MFVCGTGLKPTVADGIHLSPCLGHRDSIFAGWRTRLKAVKAKSCIPLSQAWLVKMEKIHPSIPLSSETKTKTESTQMASI